MTKSRYTWTVLLPTLLVCWPTGKLAKKIECLARKIRLKSANKMRKALDARPAPGGE